MRRFFFGLAVFALAAPMPLLAETTDRQIAQQIISLLKSQKENGELKGFNLDLQVEDGAVYLKGFVSEREQRRKAIEAARHVKGVKQVYNEIEVKHTESPEAKPLGDGAPAKKLEVKTVNAPFATPPEPPQLVVDMTAEDEEPAMATKLSAKDREIGGLLEAEVTEPAVTNPAVTNPVLAKAPVNVFRTPQTIQVVNEQPIGGNQVAPVRTAREITEAIVKQYRVAMARGELQGFGIDVQVKQGVVWLKGTVSSPAQLTYAIEVARDVQGVKKVVNALDISGSEDMKVVSHERSDAGVQHAFRQDSSPSASDGEAERIAKEVVAGLNKQKQEGLLTNFGIDVQVDQRTVWMSGYVKDSGQHIRALDVARYVPGVERVVNDLKIWGQGTPLRPVNVTPTQGVSSQPVIGQQVLNYQMVPVRYVPVQAMQASNQTPMAFAPARPASHAMMQPGQPVPMTGNAGVGIAPARFDHPQMPGYAWPSYAPSPNYGAVTYPKQYSPSAWPYIGPFYPYPQVPLGWRRVTLEWDDGWWNLKFKNTRMH
ncbi:MAG: BON domain-containing protein [Pirellulaceae bacterium]|jgi:osmotically-inducible protein OsmY|nr:BON domain-containing protein [Pirellulaceae bacterium]